MEENDTSNAKEDIEWLVLAKEDNKILIISNKALDCQPYNTSNSSVTWENCSLRDWVNGAFFDAAFDDTEKSIIEKTNVPAVDNSTNSSSSTKDKVFLLSAAEAKEYFSNSTTLCEATKYAVANGAYDSDSGGCWWWLRSNSEIKYYRPVVDCVNTYGGIDYNAHDVDYSIVGVRLAMWIDLGD